MEAMQRNRTEDFSADRAASASFGDNADARFWERQRVLYGPSRF